MEEKDFSSIDNFGLISIQRVGDLSAHPTNDKLEIARVLGESCVVKKGSLKIGEYIAYCKNNVLLSKKMAKSFPHLEKGKVVKRFVNEQESNGLCIHLSTVLKNLPLKTKNVDVDYSFEVGEDISEFVGATSLNK